MWILVLAFKTVLWSYTVEHITRIFVILLVFMTIQYSIVVFNQSFVPCLKKLKPFALSKRNHGIKSEAVDA